MSNRINLKNLTSADPRVKYSCARTIVTLAKKSPQTLRPYLPTFLKLLKQNNKIITWTAIDAIGAIASISPAARTKRLLKTLYPFLNTGNMITAGHATNALTMVAVAQPDTLQYITRELLKVEQYRYDTTECRNIAIGHVLAALRPFDKALSHDQKITKFAKRQIKNSRSATAKKATTLLQQLTK